MTYTLNQFKTNLRNSSIITKLNLQNSYLIPSIEKIDVNVNYRANIIKVLYALQLIFGKKAKLVKAKKSVASFNLREGSITSYKVTLRGEELNNFISLLSIHVLPKSTNKSIKVDKYSNINIGISDIRVFPQIEHEYDRISASIGMNISIITNCTNQLTNKLLTKDTLKSTIK